MKTKSGDFVLPGDALGVTEEFVPSEWTYEDEGKIRIPCGRNSISR